MNVYFLGPFANDRNNSCGNSDSEVIFIRKIMMRMAMKKKKTRARDETTVGHSGFRFLNCGTKMEDTASIEISGKFCGY